MDHVGHSQFPSLNCSLIKLDSKITVGLRVRLNGRPRDHRSEMPMTGLHGNGTVSLNPKK
jgi:hypothetical protein